MVFIGYWSVKALPSGNNFFLFIRETKAQRETIGKKITKSSGNLPTPQSVKAKAKSDKYIFM